MIRRTSIFIPALAVLCLLGPMFSATVGREKPSVRQLPGLQPDGEVLLPNQWSLRPVGKQIDLGDLPVNIAMHPKAPWAAILHSGFAKHEIVVIDTKTGQVKSRTGLPVSFYGLCFDPEGKRLFASGGESGVVHQYRFTDGTLTAEHDISLGAAREQLIPAGLACSADGKMLYVACCWGHLLEVVTLERADSPKRLALPDGSHPYTVLPCRSNDQLYVSLWGKAAVAVVDPKTLRVEAEWPTESHPTEMALSPDEKVLYVACSDSNTVSVLDTATGRPLEIISTALYPQAPHGSTPNSLALSPDGKTLFIANADNNNVAVIDVSRRGQSHSLGFIPVGWYPTSVRTDRVGESVFVANGKGLVPKANPHGPMSPLKGPKRTEEYIGSLFRGTLSILSRPTADDMARYTKAAYECSPYRTHHAPRDEQHHAERGEYFGPIKHCIYIIKENRTYDQVLGDMPEGNGDARLCIFGERVTPNHHALARQFVLLDNFYVDGEVSADGHEWSMAAYATDFVEKTWPLTYRPGGGYRPETHGRSTGKILGYPSEGAFAIAQPSSGYIWDRCREAGVSYRSYGEFVANPDKPGGLCRAKVKNLEGHIDPHYQSFDLNYPDSKRADRLLEELKRFEKEGQMPQFTVVRLPSDHTHGTSPGKLTPTAMVADNDLALGRIIEAISHSRFWPTTAVFVLEDDAQNGSDHVDAHRSPALVISPYTKRHYVDSSMYSTSSMLRTMELILGLRPMSQYDAAARPMDASFQSKPDLTPYQHLPARVDMNARNNKLSWGAAESSKMDFTKEDAADDLLLNEIVWRSVRGADSPMPPPVRASFVRVQDKDED